jgi:hypothetical protein
MKDAEARNGADKALATGRGGDRRDRRHDPASPSLPKRRALRRDHLSAALDRAFKKDRAGLHMHS